MNAFKKWTSQMSIKGESSQTDYGRGTMTAPARVDSVGSRGPNAPPRTETDTRIVAEMDSRFYTADEDECAQFVVRQLDASCTEKDLNAALEFHHRLEKGIGQQLSAQIFANYNAFVNIMEGIQAIENDLAGSVELVSGTRRVLQNAQRNLVTHSFRTVALHRKLIRINAVRQKCKALLDLVAADAALQDAMRSLSFASALEQLARADQLKRDVEGIQAASAVLQTFADGYARFERHLQASLDALLLEAVSGAHALDTKALQGMAQAFYLMEVQLGFANRVSEAFAHATDAAMHAGVQRQCQAVAGADTTTSTLTFLDICASVRPAQFSACYEAALHAALVAMHTYFVVRQVLDEQFAADPPTCDAGRAFAHGLGQGRVALWERIQHRLVQLLRSTTATALENNIAEMESMSTRSEVLMRVGEQFSGIVSSVLRPALADKCMQFATSFHVQSVERLVLAIDSESWQRVPLAADFWYSDIKELRHEAVQMELADHAARPDHDRLFQQFADGVDILRLASSSPGPSPSAATAPVSAVFRPASAVPWITTSSALLPMQTLGRYLQLERCLPSVATHVASLSVDLFHVYLLGVFSLFSPEYARFLETHPAYGAFLKRFPRLCTVLNHIVSGIGERKFAAGAVRFIAQQQQQQQQPATTSSPSGPQIARLQAGVQLDGIEDLFGLPVRYLAIESLKRIAGAYQWVVPITAQYVTTKNAEIPDAAAYTAGLCADLEQAVYWFLATRLMTETLRPVLGLIGTCKWDISELKETCNTYVDRIKKSFQQLHARLSKMTSSNEIQAAVSQVFLGNCLRITMDLVVDALSSVKKCTTEGRAAMSLDSGYLQRGLRDVAGVWPIPGGARVDDYIKAYYLQPNELLAWIQSHSSEFTLDHFLGIVRVSPGTSSMRAKELAEFTERVNRICGMDAERRKSAIPGPSHHLPI
ncbi:Vacuolar protein sorting-associated protein 51 like protein [Plasmodiophora brassicae]